MLHKVLNSYLILGFLRLPDFALLMGLEDARDSQKQRGHSHSIVPVGYGVIVFAGHYRLASRSEPHKKPPYTGSGE